MFRNYHKIYENIIKKAPIDKELKQFYLATGAKGQKNKTYAQLLSSLAHPIFTLHTPNHTEASEYAKLAGQFDRKEGAKAYAKMAESMLDQRELAQAQEYIQKASELDPFSKPGEQVYETAQRVLYHSDPNSVPHL